MWLTDFKIAVLQKDAAAIDALLDAMPSFETAVEAEEAFWLVKEAQNVMLTLQEANRKSMIQIQKNLKFLKSTQTDRPGNLNIIS